MILFPAFPAAQRQVLPPIFAKQSALSARLMITSGNKILVHCHAGRSRSVAIVAAYLIKHQGLCTSEALNLIQSKREINLASGMEEIFIMLDLKN